MTLRVIGLPLATEGTRTDRSGKPFTLFTHGGMYMDLKELLGREVDLVVEGTLRPYAAERANQDKKLIYERKVA